MRLSLCPLADRRILLRRVVRRLFALLLLLSVVLATVACKKSDAAVADTSTPPVVTDASGDLEFTWIDEHGDGHTETRVADVPLGARDVVRVLDANSEPPQGAVWVADLRNAGPGGAYRVRTIKRGEWEATAIARRDGGVLAERPPASAAPAGKRPDVIIYGASWCGPCHQAAAHLKKKGVPFVEKDIEEDRGAAREMHAKLQAAGKRGGSIPVLDVRGRILVGFDADAVDRALGQPM